jgi:hypothetical protein
MAPLVRPLSLSVALGVTLGVGVDVGVGVGVGVAVGVGDGAPWQPAVVPHFVVTCVADARMALVPPWQAAQATGVGGVPVLVRWQVLQVAKKPAWAGTACTVVCVWQLSQGPIPPTAVVNVGRALAFGVTSDTLRAMAARRISSTTTG